MHRRTVLSSLLAAASAPLAACARPAHDQPAAAVPTTAAPTTAAAPTSPAAATPTASAPDLSGMLIRPEGYIAVRGDGLSGPVGRSDAARVFADHPDDAGTVLRHGFLGGYLQGWKSPDPTFDAASTAIPDTTTLVGAVLQFDTTGNARAILQYFQQQSRADGYQPFTVPSSLSGGYGFRQEPGNAGLTYLSVTWMKGARLLQWSGGYSEPRPSTDRLIRLAMRQNAAAPA
ncbi:hypothetical protein AB0M46_40295 [Dactylosporangium sp. NPDC051485]|uniref:hypothetical protein n=1 Tax=Dactylosporangium sp. NPDC051485 TaxID=3154846 RepID=UPI00343E942C